MIGKQPDTIAIGMSLILMSAPVIQPVLIFAVFTSAMNKSLDSATAFTTIALFNILRFPFAVMPMGFLQYMNCKVSSLRMSKFLAKKTLVSYLSEVSDEGITAAAGDEVNEAMKELQNDPTLQYAVRRATFG
jgi:hypothetical protein